ncbi:uncharacterized protein LOC135597690 [Musa acuminata AAA Group]|uniref:uncharacterized protein LOC135597690 n=1 Tax=Musa acuminata AAA Group TaxID=214697 RepID=UPI0031D63EB2
MVRLEALRGVEAPAVASNRSPSVTRAGASEAPVDVEAGRPRKRARVLSSGGPEAVTASAGGVMVPAGAEGVVASTDHAARSQTEGEAAPSGHAVTGAPRQPSIRELLCLPLGEAGEPYLAREVGALPRGAATDPLVGRWDGLTRGSRVWADGDHAAKFVRGGLHPDIARDLYTLSSETLLSKSAKSLLWGNHYVAALMDRVRDAGRVIAALSSRNAELRKQADEARAGAGPEAVAAAERRASDLEAEAVRLRSELQASTERSAELQMRLETSEGRNTELQMNLRASVAEARSARADSLEVLRRLEESRAEARRVSEALDAETRQRPGRDKKLIEDYKGSPGFQLGLVRTGRVSYEYGYRVALARFRVRNPGSEVVEDPFDSFPEDLDVGMPSDVPFDDSPDAPEG